MKRWQPNSAYRKDLLKQSSKRAFRLLQHSLHGEVELKNFGKQELDLTHFDWCSGPTDRNWWWQVQQLPFVRWFVQSNALWVDYSEKPRVAEFLVGALLHWDQAVEKLGERSPLCWHDHVAALRLRILLDFYVVALQHPIFDELMDGGHLPRLILRHTDWLSCSHNYSRGTNHGLEQAEALYRATVIFPDERGLKSSGHLGYKRLIDELDQSFTEQGVHKENSPGYQKFMINKLRSLQELLASEGSGQTMDMETLYEKAQRFLKVVTMPNGRLPAIGDTQFGESGVLGAVEPDFVVDSLEGRLRFYDYRFSGYIVVKYHDRVTSSDGFFLVKSSHASHYHRHDDDLSVFWQVGDDCLLGDAGLFSHNEKDFERLFVRSVYGHNGVSVAGVSADRSLSKLRRPPIVDVLTDPIRIAAQTWCFDRYRIRRVINLERLCVGRLLVEDRVHAATDNPHQAEINWFLPDGGKSDISVIGDDVCLRNGAGLSLTFSFPNSEVRRHGVSIVRGVGADISTSAIHSKGFGSFEPATRVLTSLGAPGSMKTSIQLALTA